MTAAKPIAGCGGRGCPAQVEGLLIRAAAKSQNLTALRFRCRRCRFSCLQW